MPTLYTILITSQENYTVTAKLFYGPKVLWRIDLRRLGPEGPESILRIYHGGSRVAGILGGC